jgi:hypothetical protein
MENPRAARLAAGWPQHKLAAVAGVSPGLVRLYEANPSAVADAAKRAALDQTYEELRRATGADA